MGKPDAGLGESMGMCRVRVCVWKLTVVGAWVLLLLGGPGLLEVRGDGPEDRQEIDQRFATELAQLAARCNELGLSEQAAITRAWYIPRDPRRLYLFLPAVEKPLGSAGEVPTVVKQWHAAWTELRRRQADALFALSERALEGGDAARAFRLLHEVLHENPEHALARRILSGYLPEPGLMIRARPGRSVHPRLGWARGDYWRVDTPHFRVTTNHGPQAGTEAARLLEQLHWVWQQVFFDFWSAPNALGQRFAGRAGVLGRKHRHEVVLLRDRENYLQLLTPVEPQIAISTGYYLKGDRTAFLYAGDAALHATWFHEVTHQLFHENGPHENGPHENGPRLDEVGERESFWIVEGIAVYMESLVPHDGYWTLGGFEADRLQYARARSLRGDFYMPLDELEQLGRADLQSHQEIRKLYSQSAGLAHFLMNGQQGRLRQPLVRILRLLYAGEDAAGLLEQFTGVDNDEVDHRYNEFLQVTDRDLLFINPPDEVRNLSLARTAVTDRGLAQLRDHQQLEWLDLAFTAVTDQGLSALPALNQLRQLSLEGTSITDAALEVVGSWTALEELDLSGTQISDKGTARLAGLRNLRRLWLSGTRVSDRTLAVLSGLDQLEQVEVTGTGVTEQGWRDFQQTLSGR